MSKQNLIGKKLHDSHRITRLIGRGGMGTVYEAEHVRLSNRRFAIKVLHARMAEDQSLYTRFWREAEIATKLGHRHIVDVLDFYETDDGRPCIVMELLEGENLARRAAREKRMTPEDVVALLEQVGDALQAAHDGGIVHRDLKPANIFLVHGPDGEIEAKLLDFGISKIRDCDTQITHENSIMGTTSYMSPEQAEGEVHDIDQTTDIFALAIICYRLLCGINPFKAPTLHGTIYRICHKQPAPVTLHATELSPAVDLVIGKALAKDKTQRYQQVMLFVEDLRVALLAEQPAAQPDDAPEPGVSAAAAVAAAPPAAPLVPGPTNIVPVDQVLRGSAPLTRGKTEETISDFVALPALEEEQQASPSEFVNTTLTDAAGQRPVREEGATRPRRSRLPWIALAAAAALLVSGAILLVLLDPHTSAREVWSGADAPPGLETTPKVTAPHKTAATPAPPRVASSQVPSVVRLKLKLWPSSARVIIDDTVRLDNPLLLEPSDRPRRLRVEADGYIPEARDLVVQRDRALSVRLLPKQGGAETHPRSRPKPRSAPSVKRVRRPTPVSRPRPRMVPKAKPMPRVKPKPVSRLKQKPAPKMKQAPRPKPVSMPKKKKKLYDDL